MPLHPKFKVAIDIGSSKIGGIIYCKNKESNITIKSSQIFASKGFERGLIVNSDDAENTIMQMINALEKDYGNMISIIDIATSCYFKSFFINHEINIANFSITDEHIQTLIKQATTKFKQKDLGLSIIYSDPIEFFIDNKKVDNPKSLVCQTLRTTLHIIAIPKSIVQGLRAAFLKLNIKINQFVCPVMASGMLCLPSEIKKNGGIIFDLGAYTTSFCIFINNKALYTKYLPIGTNQITSDITKIFSLEQHVAEKLKIMFGKIGVVSEANQLIDLTMIQNNYIPDQNVTVGELSQIIEARSNEIIQMIKADYDMLHVNNIIAKNIYVVSGGAKIQGIEIIFKRIFNRTIHKAVIPKIFKLDDIGLAACIGITLLQNNKSYETTSLESKFLGKILNWLKTNI